MFVGSTAGAYSFANTPLKAAHAPLDMASMSHADFVLGIDMMIYCLRECCVGQSNGVDAQGFFARSAGTLPSLVKQRWNRLRRTFIIYTFRRESESFVPKIPYEHNKYEIVHKEVVPWSYQTMSPWLGTTW